MEQMCSEGELILPNKKKRVKATVIKIVWFCFRNRQVDYWNWTESPAIGLNSYGKLMYDGRAISTQ